MREEKESQSKRSKVKSRGKARTFCEELGDEQAKKRVTVR